MKRWIGLLTAFAAVWLTVGSARAEHALCVTTDDLAALLAMDGTELVAPGEWDAFFCVIDGERYAAGRRGEDGNMLYALCDAQGCALTDAVYEMFDAAFDSILFRRDGLCGAMDEDGNILIENEYTQIVASGAGGFLALDGDINDNEADQILFLLPGEDPVETGVYTADGLSRFADGRMPYRSPKTQKYGYVDAVGAIVYPAELSYAGEYAFGRARAAENGLFGVLDAQGQWLLEPQFEFLEMSEDMIAVQSAQGCMLFDDQGQMLLFLEGETHEIALLDGGAAVLDAQGVSLYDAAGTLICTLEEDASASAGAAGEWIVSDGDWGTPCAAILHADGTLSERRYQYLLPLDGDRYAFMTMDVAAYSSEALGQIRYSCNYDSMRFGMIDAQETEILSAQYTEIRRLAEHRYLLIADDGLRVMDENGEVLWSRIDETQTAN